MSTAFAKATAVGPALRGASAALLVVVTIAGFVAPVAAQTRIEVYELADYRLTTAIFERFVQANARIVEITEQDASFTDAPLLTKDLALSGDAVAEAAALVTRIENHAGLTAALEAVAITPREYAKFTITLIVARLAHGFLKAGVLPRVPSGAPTTNVEFVRMHESAVIAALASLGIRD
jgi:hypothetical protein